MYTLPDLEIQDTYRAYSGYFCPCYPDRRIAFESCRESFQSQFFANDCKNMIFSCDDPIHVMNFIKQFEVAASIKEVAEFGMVAKVPKYLHIKLNFWHTQPLRLSLFTILLRSANNNPDFEVAMQCEDYLQKTLAAVMVFANGENYCLSNEQWLSTFTGTKKINNYLSVDPNTLDKKKLDLCRAIVKKCERSADKYILEVYKLIYG